MIRIFVLLIFIVLSEASLAMQAEELEVRELMEDQQPAVATLSEIAWLVGRWSGEGLGGLSEEVIAPPISGQMMGMFRQTDSDGKILFYEFYLFAEIDNSIVLRIKHFGSDFVGWEEKESYEEFPLVAVEENAVYFDGLTYALEDNNTLLAAVSVSGRGIITFEMPRSN